MNDQIWWYVARGSGVVAWLVMALGIFWGLALSSRFLGRRPKPNWMLDLHRFLGGMSVLFVGMHLASLVFDSYISFGLVDLVLPGASQYRPIAVAWGVIGLYLLIAVQATSMLRKHISKRAWTSAAPSPYVLETLRTSRAAVIAVLPRCDAPADGFASGWPASPVLRATA